MTEVKKKQLRDRNKDFLVNYICALLDTQEALEKEIGRLRKDAEVKPACEWLEVDEEEGVTYETDCENKFVCGDYEELYKTFRYCIYCGGKIKVKKRKSV